MAATRACYKPENKRKFTEPERGGMSDDVMELFYFKQFRIVRTSKGLSIRDILP